MPERGSRDQRAGTGQPAGVIEMPTLTIPVGCLCSWSVVHAAPGMNCISRLSYASAQCRHLRRHYALAELASA